MVLQFVNVAVCLNQSLNFFYIFVHYFVHIYTQPNLHNSSIGLGFFNLTSQLWVHSFDQEICVYVRVTVCTLKNDVFSLSLLSPLYQGNVVTYPHCFLTACDVCAFWLGCQIQKTQTHTITTQSYNLQLIPCHGPQLKFKILVATSPSYE